MSVRIEEAFILVFKEIKTNILLSYAFSCL